MTFLHVPTFDWIILVVLIGFGIEAYITTRSPRGGEKTHAGGEADGEASKMSKGPPASEKPASKPLTGQEPPPA